MLKSAPSSPDPSAFRGNKGQNGGNEDSPGPGIMHFPQVKCLQKLPQMSPKLKKLFNIRNRKVKCKDAHQSVESTESNSLKLSSKSTNQEIMNMEKLHPNKNDNGMRLPVTNLDIIQEKDHSDAESEIKAGQENTPNSTKLADLVLNLLKSRRQLGYRAVQSEDADAEETFEEIPIDNLKEFSEDTCASSNVNYAYNDKHEDNFIRTISEKGSQHNVLKRDNGSDSKSEVSTGNNSNIPTPKIILTSDIDHMIRYSSCSFFTCTNQTNIFLSCAITGLVDI